MAYAEEGVDEDDWEQVDAVLVDEASMLGLPLAAALLEALPQKCQLVFIGMLCCASKVVCGSF